MSDIGVAEISDRLAVHAEDLMKARTITQALGGRWRVIDASPTVGAEVGGRRQ